MIYRQLTQQLKDNLFQNKALVLLGPRQTGKTTLIRELVKELNLPTLWLSGDDFNTREEFGIHSISHMRAIAGNHKLLVIDEAQYIDNIGLSIKIFVDNIPDVQVIATGSSSFELLNVINEPLTGRKWEYQLFPLSYKELHDHNGLINENGLLDQRMIFGCYPEVINNPGNERDVLQMLTSSYLYKDLFIHQQLKKPQLVEKLVRALSFQVSNEVSYNELAQLVGADIQTIEKYIDLLEKAFIIFRLYSLSRNLRNEIKKSRKIYFYDNGIRNAVISNFSPLNSRDDVGAMWENYIVSERMKHTHYNKLYMNRYFWRTHAQQEIDYLEEYDGQLNAYEIKWNPNKKVIFSKSFTKAYPNASTQIINPKNFTDFLT
mgnify:CR=1 FL=1